MAYDYDKLYRETPNALGSPTQAFLEFFAGYDRKGARVLDLGCGQGRDAVFIARLGHRVTGVDMSPSGIDDIVAAAEQEGLAFEGHVADIRAFTPEGTFDVVVIDRTLHMLDRADRLSVLAGLLDHVAAEGWVLIADELANIGDFRCILEQDGPGWTARFARRGYLFVQRTGTTQTP